MKAKERLREMMKSEGISERSFELSCGISNGYINNVKGSLGAKIIDRISSIYPNWNMMYLISGEGSPYKDENNASTSENTAMVPRIPIEVAAGMLATIAESGVSAEECERFANNSQSCTNKMGNPAHEEKPSRPQKGVCKDTHFSNIYKTAR